MIEKLKKELKETGILLRSVPGWVMTLFVLSIVCMNLFANKSIAFSTEWLALDCGIIFSWFSFLSMDLIVKHFGAKASIKMTIISTVISLCISILFFIASSIPGYWGESFNYSDAVTVNSALDSTVRGNWYIVFGSTVAFIVAAITNSLTNEVIGKLFKKDSYKAFAVRSYLSTFFGQFVDNFIFSLIVSQVLFGWSFVQCVVCAATGALCELIFEVIFSPIGWKVCKGWKSNEVGSEYITLVGKC